MPRLKKVYFLARSGTPEKPEIGLKETLSPYYLRLRSGVSRAEKTCVLCGCAIQKGQRRWKVIANSQGPFVCRVCVETYE